MYEEEDSDQDDATGDHDGREICMYMIESHRERAGFLSPLEERIGETATAQQNSGLVMDTNIHIAEREIKKENRMHE